MPKTKDEQQIFNFITEAFKEDRYDEVVEFLEFFKNDKIEKLHETGLNGGHDLEERMQRAMDNILSFDEHSLVKWAAGNSDIEGLLLLEKYLSKDSLFEAATHNNFEALRSFLADSQAVNALRFYDKYVFQKGIEFFFKTYFKNDDAEVGIIISDSLKHCLRFDKTITEDFIDELRVLAGNDKQILKDYQLEEALNMLGQDSNNSMPGNDNNL